MGTRPDAEDLIDETLADAGDTAEVEDHFAEAVEVGDQALRLRTADEAGPVLAELKYETRGV